MKKILTVIILIYSINSYSVIEDHSEKGETAIYRINDVAWLSGHWQGEIFDGIGEEIWSSPKNGSMMGMYRHCMNSKIVFYEFMIIIEENQSLVLKLKYFNDDATTWEEKDETVDFPLIKINSDEIIFDGLNFKKINNETIKCSLQMKHENGEKYTSEWLYKRILE